MKKQQEIKDEVKRGDAGTRILFLIAGIAVGAGIYFGARKLIPEKLSIEKQLFALTNEVNKNCPMMIDNGTRFDNVIVMPGNVFQYRYTLVNAQKGYVDTVALKNYVLPNAIENIRSSADLKFQRDNKLTFSYYYKDSHGERLVDFSVTAEQYSKKSETKGK